MGADITIEVLMTTVRSIKEQVCENGHIDECGVGSSSWFQCVAQSDLAFLPLWA
jgi:hypothetical protein